MNRAKVAKAFNILLLFWFLCIPLFWHLDLSKGEFCYAKMGTYYYDTFSMAPNAFIHLIVFYALVLVSLSFSKPSPYILFLLTLYFPFIQLVNYPFITFRDVYLHAAPAQTILADGKMEYPGNPGKYSTESSWPASFILYAMSSVVLGCDLVSANYILSLALVVTITLVLYSFARTLENRGYRLALFGAVLFPCLFFSHLFEIIHYARNSLGFTLLFFFFFVFMRLKNRNGYALLSLITIATVITHPFHSFALTVFTIFYAMFAHRVERSLSAMFSVIVFISWFIFSGSLEFSQALYRLKTFLSPEYVAPVVETFSAKENMPWWGVVLRDFFKYSLIALLIVASIAVFVILLKKRANYQGDVLTFGISSLLPMAIVIMLALLLLPDWNVWRSVPFASFPAAFASFILADKIITNKKPKTLPERKKLLKRKTLISILLLWIVTLSTAVMILKFEDNYYFGEINHPSELSALSFFFTNDHNSTVYIVSWRTNLYSAYFNYNSSHQTLMLWVLDINAIAGNTTKLLYSQSLLINQSQSVMRGIRDSFTYSRLYPSETILKIIDNEMINPKFSLVYSNGYYSVYKRAIPP
ncbi:MAG: hypothetical protein ACPLKQ_04590 [Candidatus Bathyarchaeales archaeon]